jgi:dTDP-glucose 4,6-dehydratase
LKHVDIRDHENLDLLYNRYEPEITYHFAAESHVDNSIDGDDVFLSTNINGTHNILKCIKKYGGKLVHISTDEVYGSLTREDPPFMETTPYNPRNPYSATKAASDHLVRSYVNTHKIDAIVTNCSNNYGPRQHKEKFIPTVIRHIKNNTPVPVYGTGQNVRDWLYVEDHCEALLEIGKNFKSGERYNIGGGHEVSNLEMVAMILDIMGKPINMYQSWINFVSDRKGHDFRYAMNAEKIQKELGWSAKTDIIVGLEKTLEWYK